jgi:predicted O-methyltransferase YrrM
MIDISHALTVEGWMSPAELTFLAEEAAKVPQGGAIVEVGSFKGRSSCALAANTQAAIYCVDCWRDLGPEGWFVGPWATVDDHRANTSQLQNIVRIHLSSIFAAQYFAAEGTRFDLIFIDGSHNEHNVRQDITIWRPLLKEGGVLAGHDYGNADWPDVTKVVDELFPGVQVVDSIWIACQTSPPLSPS